MSRRPCEAFGSSNSNKIRHMSGTSSWVACGWPTVHGSCCQWFPCCSSMPMVQGSACSWARFGSDSVSLLLTSTSWCFPEFRSGSTSNVWKSNWLTCRHNSRWFFSTTTKLKAKWFQKRWHEVSWAKLVNCFFGILLISACVRKDLRWCECACECVCVWKAEKDFPSAAAMWMYRCKLSIKCVFVCRYSMYSYQVWLIAAVYVGNDDKNKASVSSMHSSMSSFAAQQHRSWPACPAQWPQANVGSILFRDQCPSST